MIKKASRDITPDNYFRNGSSKFHYCNNEISLETLPLCSYNNLAVIIAIMNYPGCCLRQDGWSEK
jgi:hypothetical protein